MRLLLDTNVIIWILNEVPIAKEAESLLRDPGNSVFISVINAWEIAVKEGIGKLIIPKEWESILKQDYMEMLPLTFQYVSCLKKLPPLHRDPFDRMLLAQAMAEGLTLVTRDRTILQYPLPTLEA